MDNSGRRKRQPEVIFGTSIPVAQDRHIIQSRVFRSSAIHHFRAVQFTERPGGFLSPSRGCRPTAGSDATPPVVPAHSHGRRATGAHSGTRSSSLRSSLPMIGDHPVAGAGTISPIYTVGTGPSEIHAHIDLDNRRRRLHPSATTTVVTTVHQDGHWSVIAEVRDLPAEEWQ